MIHGLSVAELCFEQGAFAAYLLQELTLALNRMLCDAFERWIREGEAWGGVWLALEGDEVGFDYCGAWRLDVEGIMREAEVRGVANLMRVPVTLDEVIPEGCRAVVMTGVRDFVLDSVLSEEPAVDASPTLDAMRWEWLCRKVTEYNAVLELTPHGFTVDAVAVLLMRRDGVTTDELEDAAEVRLVVAAGRLYGRDCHADALLIARCSGLTPEMRHAV